ncbi:hypothetical protein IV102_04105 [bacterium]|nr:hypothetical protein [bacterium]
MRHILQRPGPGQAQALLDFEWLVLCSEDLPVTATHAGFWAQRLFTEAAALALYRQREPGYTDQVARPITGHQLFPLLAERQDFDAIFIDPHAQPERPPFGPNFAYELAQHRDPRPEAQILKARSIAEIHEFCDQHGLADRTHRLVYWEEQLVAEYGRFRFHPVQPQPNPRDFGPGPSSILCGGKLLEHLSRLLDNLKSARAERALAPEALSLLNEVEKLLEPEQESLPRHALRLPEGARFARARWDMTQRHWLAQTRDFLEALLKEPGAPLLIQEPTATNLEEALLKPGPGQVSLLLDGNWWVLRGRDGLAVSPGGLALLFSQEQHLTVFLDRLEEARLMTLQPERRHRGDGWYAVPIVHWNPVFETTYPTQIRGHELFEQLSQPAACSAIRVNAGHNHSSLEFGPSDAAALLQGVDPRPEARILQARSLAELDMFFSQQGLHEISQRKVCLAGQELSQYTGRGALRDKRFYFHPVQLRGGSGELAPGRTMLLCAGRLADLVSRVLAVLEGLPVEMLAERCDWAAELVKLIDPETDRIPDTELRDPYGRNQVAENPFLLQGAWLREALQTLRIAALTS